MLQQQILVRDEKLIFQLSTAAVEFRGSAQYTAHRIVLLPGAQVVLSGPHCADEKIFGVSSGEIYSTTDTLYPSASSFNARMLSVSTSLNRALNTPNLVSGSRPGSVYWSSSSLWHHGTQAIYFARARIAVESARSVAISQACSEMTAVTFFGGW